MKVCRAQIGGQRSLTAAFGSSLIFPVLTQPRATLAGRRLQDKVCGFVYYCPQGGLPLCQRKRFECYSCNNPMVKKQTYNWITCAWYEDVGLPAVTGCE